MKIQASCIQLDGHIISINTSLSLLRKLIFWYFSWDLLLRCTTCGTRLSRAIQLGHMVPARHRRNCRGPVGSKNSSPLNTTALKNNLIRYMGGFIPPSPPSPSVGGGGNPPSCMDQSIGSKWWRFCGFKNGYQSSLPFGWTYLAYIRR